MRVSGTIPMRFLTSLKWTVAAAACLACLPGLKTQGQQRENLLFGQTRQEFASRRDAVRAAAGYGIVLVRGEVELDDIERVRFRTDNDIMYLTGVEAPSAYLVLLPPGDPSGKREILYLPDQPESARQWVDPIPGPGAATEKATGIASVRDVRNMWKDLQPSIEQGKTLYLDGPFENSAKFSPLGMVADKVRSINPKIDIQATAGQMIHPLRWRKSPGEIANLRGAIAATGQAERNAAKLISPNMTEIAVEGTIIDAFRRGGAPREGFPSIVGSGPNSTVLHHFAGDRRMKAGETVVVDIGAEYNYYSADITRTFPCGGKFTPRQRELYQLVLDTQSACHKYVKPGKTTLGELHRYAVDFLRKSPLRAKDEAGNSRTMDTFFVHGLGHWLGMDVHDVGGSSMVLEPGVVFTIEPGVYVRSEGIGIRIEDDYLVTANGVEKLSAAIPCEVPQVEAMMRGSAPKKR
jgi:Xaa-Pro aminopeptidase